MFTLGFWKRALERAIKTAAQALVALWAGDVALDAFSVDWAQTAGIAAGAAVLSILTSIISEPFGDQGDPSLVKPEI